MSRLDARQRSPGGAAEGETEVRSSHRHKLVPRAGHGYPASAMENNQARWTLQWLGCSVLLGLSVGCSSQSAETKRQLETLNERLLILQNDRDRLVERVDALESQLTKPAGEPKAPAAASGSGARPLLKVVRLEPSPAAEGETPASKAGSAPAGAPAPIEVAEGPAPSEPQVVLYGEGSTSGVRPSAEGVK